MLQVWDLILLTNYHKCYFEKFSTGRQYPSVDYFVIVNVIILWEKLDSDFSQYWTGYLAWKNGGENSYQPEKKKEKKNMRM